MTTVILVCTLFTLGVETGRDVGTVVKAFKAVHHHTTRPLYRHALKPIAKTMQKAVKP